MKGKKTKRILALFLAVVMSISMIVPAIADDVTFEADSSSLTYDAPTEPMAVDEDVITATAHRAASPVLGMMGLNAKSGFGMIQGSAPTTLAEAEACFALGVWGTSANSNPDPYYWNYFYNFYAAENGLEESEDALLNPSAAASPVAADTTLVEEYGNISVSLYTRPEIVIGCASSGSGSDTNGYDSQLATINSFTSVSEYYQEGDETYSPYLVSYQTTYIDEMIDSVYRIADAINEIEEEDPTKHTRYDDDPEADYYITADETAAKYEAYVYGVITYVQSQLAAEGKEEKTVAIVTAVNDDGTYSLADSVSTSSTSLVRAWEYTMGVSTNLLDVLGKTSSDTVTLDELLQADAIVTINNQSITADVLTESFGTAEYDGTIIAKTPSAMYGMTQNSVENAMGFAFVIGCLYPEYVDPVEWCAYFYETFLHVTDQDSIQQCIDINFASVSLPSGVSTTLTDYSAEKIEACIAEGYEYYLAHKDDVFTETAKDGFYDSDHIGLILWGTRSAGELTVSGQTEYQLGAELDLTVELTSEGIAESVEVSDYTVEGYDANTLGTQTITVTYGDLTATLDVEVTPRTVDVIVGEETIPVNVTELEEAAEEQTFTRIRNGETTEITAKFVSINDILDAAGVEYDTCTVATTAASDGYSRSYALGGEDAVDVYLYFDGDAYRSAVNGSAANMWVSGVVTITVTEDHVWDDGVITTEAADYTSTGIKTYTCTVCGETKTEEYTFVNGEVTDNVRTAILWAAENGISKGYTTGADAGTFGVGNTVTREEMIIFIRRLAKYTGVSTSARADVTFSDVDDFKTETGKVAASWAAAEGIAKGYSDGTYGPQNECTREQICIFLWRLAGKPSVTDEELAAVSDFSDADEISHDTARKAIAWAYSEGIIKGYTDSDEFGPQDSCLREQFAIMMYRYANN